MVTTNDAKLAETVRTLRDHAFSKERHFWHKSRNRFVAAYQDIMNMPI